MVTFVGWFALVAGAGIIGLWTMLLLTRQVPEVAEDDRAIWFHLVAEYLLGSMLCVSGIAILVVGDEPIPRALVVAALGGTVYSAINSAGYYARAREWWIVGGFAVITALALTSLAMVITSA